MINWMVWNRTVFDIETVFTRTVFDRETTCAKLNCLN